MPETGARLTYRQLQRALDDAISLMRGLGIENGDRVALTAANGPALILAFLAVTECGAATTSTRTARSAGGPAWVELNAGASLAGNVSSSASSTGSFSVIARV